MIFAVALLALAAESGPSKAQVEVLKAINASGPQVDACTQRYLLAHPDADGAVELEAIVNEEGKVTEATANTKLTGARRLRPCLEGVAKGWKLPPPSEHGASVGIKVTVKKGAKFRIRLPGDAPPKPPPGADEDEGLFTLTPSSFLPKGW